MFDILVADHRAEGNPDCHLKKTPGIWTVDQRVSIKPGGIEEESQLLQEGFCRNRVQRDEAEEWRVSKFTGSHATAERVANPRGPT
jgi:hypothetical protein